MCRSTPLLVGGKKTAAAHTVWAARQSTITWPIQLTSQKFICNCIASIDQLGRLKSRFDRGLRSGNDGESVKQTVTEVVERSSTLGECPLGSTRTFTFGNEANDSAGVNDCDGHSLAVRRAASSIRLTVGTYASSKTGAKGTGVCGQVTTEIGAFSRANPRSETIAATSAASEQRGGLSST